MAGKFLSVSNLSPQGVAEVYERTSTLKKSAGRFRRFLEGRQVCVVEAEKADRWRLPLDVAIQRLGAHAVTVEAEREARDPAALLASLNWSSLFSDCTVMRGLEHKILATVCEKFDPPVINAGSSREEPVHALADFFTVWEMKGMVEGLRMAYLGPTTPRFSSMLQIGARLGAQIWIGCPEKQQPPSDMLLTSRLDARQSKGRIEVVNDAERAIRGADVIYLAEWGKEISGKDLKLMNDFVLTPELVQLGKPDVIVMHPNGWNYGAEVKPGVIEHPSCIYRQQALNLVPVMQSLICGLIEKPNAGVNEAQQAQTAPAEATEQPQQGAFRPKQVPKGI